MTSKPNLRRARDKLGARAELGAEAEPRPGAESWLAELPGSDGAALTAWPDRLLQEGGAEEAAKGTGEAEADAQD